MAAVETLDSQTPEPSAATPDYSAWQPTQLAVRIHHISFLEKFHKHLVDPELLATKQCLVAELGSRAVEPVNQKALQALEKKRAATFGNHPLFAAEMEPDTTTGPKHFKPRK